MALVEQSAAVPTTTAVVSAARAPSPSGVSLDDCRDVALLRRGR